jgi:hypothetical protein
MLLENNQNQVLTNEYWPKKWNRPNGRVLLGAGGDLIFRDIVNRQLSFGNLLPDRWKFESHIFGDFQADQASETIFYGDLSNKFALFDLLHEIGHAHLIKSGHSSEKIISEFYEFAKNYAKQDGNVKKAENSEEYKEINIFNPISKQLGKQIRVPVSVLRKYGSAVAENERLAWAYALKKIRELENKRIILEPEINDLSGFQEEIYRALNSYDQIFSENYLKDLGGIFNIKI